MRYIAAAALHQKALNVLSVIEDAEERIKMLEKYIRRADMQFSNWQRELHIWPLGKPSPTEIESWKQEKIAHEAAHKRLCKYYQTILSRLIDIA